MGGIDGRRMGERQPDADRRPLALHAFDLGDTARLPRDAEYLAKAKSGAFAQRLGRIKGIEHFGQEMAGDAGAIVAHPHDTIIARCKAVGGVMPHVRLDRQYAAVGHGVPRVDGQVQYRQFKLMRVRHDPGLCRCQRALLVDAWPDGPCQKIGHAIDQRVHAERGKRQLLRSGKGEQLMRQFRGPVRRFGCEAGVPQYPVVVGPPLDHFQIAGHHRQQIVEVMRDAAGQLADRFHLLRLDQCRLRPFAFGHFLHQHVVGA
jgi:hypothetical protein